MVGALLFLSILIVINLFLECYDFINILLFKILNLCNLKATFQKRKIAIPFH